MMKIDKGGLKRKASKLQNLLFRYAANDAETKILLNGLSRFINDALAEKIDSPLQWTDLPGAYLFNEGNLRQYSDLESAYSDFKIEITGGESPVLRRLREGEARKSIKICIY